MKPLQIDGTTGEGGGQLVRVACGLAALTSTPVTITNVRGNREGGRGGGLKSQHVTSISWLAQVTDAETDGLYVGSKNLTFSPRRPPTDLTPRKFTIAADSDAASALLVLQAVFPYILFSGEEPLELDLVGGTNVCWSLSFEYFDQVLLPTVEERFGVVVERALRQRGWSLGQASRGHIWLKVHPVPKGQTLKYTPPRYDAADAFTIERVDVTVLVPEVSHDAVRHELQDGLAALYPGAQVVFRHVEDSGDEARWNILLVAHSAAGPGIRWGRDVLFSMPKKGKTARDVVIAQQCRRVCRELYEDVGLGGTVDEFLQDQLVSLQALAEGYSSFPRGGESVDPGLPVERLRRDKTHEPFGHGSGHATTARWVVSQLLPQAQFYNKGDVVKGVGFSL